MWCAGMSLFTPQCTFELKSQALSLGVGRTTEIFPLVGVLICQRGIVEVPFERLFHHSCCFHNVLNLKIKLSGWHWMHVHSMAETGITVGSCAIACHTKSIWHSKRTEAFTNFRFKNLNNRSHNLINLSYEYYALFGNLSSGESLFAILKARCPVWAVECPSIGMFNNKTIFTPAKLDCLLELCHKNMFFNIFFEQHFAGSAA